MASQKLTDTAVRNAKLENGKSKLADGGGLYLFLTQAGGKSWRYKYRINGKERTYTMGMYPEVSLKEARERHFEARKLVAQGIDPNVAKRQKQVQAGARIGTFEAVARDWHERNTPKWVESHARRILNRLSKEAFPWLGDRPIEEIKAPELLAVIRRIEQRGAVDIAHRVLQTCGQVFRYAISIGLAERDIAADLRGALTPKIEKHHAALTDPKEVAGLLRAIDEYTGSFVTRCALSLAPLLFVRPGELRHAEWTEIDFETAEWRIPAKKMKMKAEHIVPLARQSLHILLEIHALTGGGRYVFPGERSAERPMSENAVNAALRRMGYTKDEMTGHGFRTTASTLLNEQGWPPDVIERQLAHAERNKIRAAYNRAEYLPERRKMMQAWADYLDELKSGRARKNRDGQKRG